MHNGTAVFVHNYYFLGVKRMVELARTAMEDNWQFVVEAIP
jgi:hypothetical protein